MEKIGFFGIQAKIISSNRSDFKNKPWSKTKTFEIQVMQDSCNHISKTGSFHRDLAEAE